MLVVERRRFENGGWQEEEKEPHLLLEAFIHIKAFVAILEPKY